MAAEGAEQLKSLQSANFSPEEIRAWEVDTRAQLQEAGFSSEEIGEFFGTPEPNMVGAKTYFEDLAHTVPEDAPEEVTDVSFLDALNAGFQQSVTGLFARGEAPDVVLPENVGTFDRIVASSATLAGDLPAMVVGAGLGAAGGAAIGSSVPIAGTAAGGVVGGGAGAFALPTALRETLMDGYENGGFKSFSDFWERASAVAVETGKASIIGGATAGVGPVGKIAAPAAKPLVQGAIAITAEVSTMVGVGAALDGRVPEPEEFLDAAILLGGLKLSTSLASKMRQHYAKTGETPAEVIERVEQDPSFKEKFLSDQKVLELDPIENPAPKVQHAIPESVPVLKDIKLEITEATPYPRVEMRTTAPQAMDVINATGKDYPGSRMIFRAIFEQDRTFVPGKLAPNTEMPHLTSKGEPLVATWWTTSLENAKRIAESKSTGVTGETGKVEIVATRLDSMPQEVYVQNVTPLNDIGHVWVGIPSEIPLAKVGKVSTGEKFLVDFRKGERDVTADQARPDVGRVAGDEAAAGVQEPGRPRAGRAEEPAPSIFDRATDDGRNGRPRVERKPETPEGNVLERISVGEKEPRRPITLSKLYTNFVDGQYPLKQITDAIVGKGAPQFFRKNPYMQARLLAGVGGKIKHFLQIGSFEFGTLKNKTKPFEAIIEPHKENLDGLRAYMVSKRALELESRGIRTGVDKADATQTVVNGTAKYDKAFRELVEYQDTLLDYAQKSGLLSEEALSAIRETNKEYVPFFRKMDTIQQVAAGKGLTPVQVIKKIKGSELQIIDPLESIVKNTHHIIQMAERNNVGKTLVELAETTEGGEAFVRKVGKAKVDFSREEVSLLKEAHKEEFGIKASTDEALALRPDSLSPKENQIVVYEKGQRTLYEVAPEVAAVFKGLDQESMNFFLRVMQQPASFLRAGAVLSPEFMARNPLRDQFMAFVTSGGGLKPLVGFAKGISSLAKKDAHYEAWLKSGGPGSTLVAMDRKYLQHELAKLQGTGGRMDRAINVAKSPIEQLRVLSELGENATRLGEFKRVTKGAVDVETLQKGAFASKEITLDFARIGAKMKAMNAITAFFNASIQGTDRVARAMKDNPKATSAAIGAGITLPSVLLWAANRNDRRYQELPDWQKDLFWIIPTDKWEDATAEDAEGVPDYLVREENGKTQINKGPIYRVPKPFELGVIFGSGAERSLEAIVGDDPEAMDGFLMTMAEGMLPSFVPTGAVPVIESYSNKSIFSGGPIIPGPLENQLPEYQYKPYTTETAKALGKFIAAMPNLKQSKAASPVIIENYIRAWTGGLGGHVMNIVDTSLKKAGVLPDPVRPAKTLADLPVIKAFVVRHPSASAKSIQKFYDKFVERRTVLNTIKQQAKAGNFEASLREAQLAPAALLDISNVADALSTHNKAIQMITVDPSMDEDEKRQIIDRLYYQMIEISKVGNDLIEEIDKSILEIEP
jgi:hypothetical protein